MLWKPAPEWLAPCLADGERGARLHLMRHRIYRVHDDYDVYGEHGVDDFRDDHDAGGEHGVDRVCTVYGQSLQVTWLVQPVWRMMTAPFSAPSMVMPRSVALAWQPLTSMSPSRSP